MKLIKKTSCNVSASKQINYRYLMVQALKNNFIIEWKSYVLGSVLSWIGIYLFILQDGEIDYFGKYYSLADCYIRMLQPIAYSVLVIPFLLIGTCRSIKVDFCVPQLLRRKSKKEMLIIQEMKLAGMSLFYAIIYLIGVSIAGIKKTEVMINWSNMNSVFCIKTQCTMPNISLVHVIILFLIMTFIRNYLFSNIILFIQWLYENVTIGLFIIICICCFEITQEKAKVLLWIFTIDYPIWINQSRRIDIVIFGLGYVLIVFLIFKITITYKEFLHEK